MPVVWVSHLSAEARQVKYRPQIKVLSEEQTQEIHKTALSILWDTGVQVKAAGGVRDLDAAIKVREIGCTRFGATRTEGIMEECYKRKKSE